MIRKYSIKLDIMKKHKGQPLYVKQREFGVNELEVLLFNGSNELDLNQFNSAIAHFKTESGVAELDVTTGIDFTASSVVFTIPQDVLLASGRVTVEIAMKQDEVINLITPAIPISSVGSIEGGNNIGLNTYVEQVLNSIKELDEKLDSVIGIDVTDLVTQTIMEEFIAGELTGYYTKDEVDNLVANIDTITEQEVRNIVTNELLEYYTKNEIDNMFNQLNIPTEARIGELIDAKLTGYYTKEEIDLKLSSIVIPEGKSQYDYFDLELSQDGTHLVGYAVDYDGTKLEKPNWETRSIVVGVVRNEKNLNATLPIRLANNSQETPRELYSGDAAITFTGLNSSVKSTESLPFEMIGSVDGRIKFETAAFHSKVSDLSAVATRALNADHASTSDTAGHSSTSGTASHATTADSSTESEHSKTSDSAGHSDTAGHATTASDASYATSAGHADTAQHSTTADNATTSDSAKAADTATHATTADRATNSDNAAHAVHATTADSATHATGSDTATNAIQAEKSLTSNLSLESNIAKVSNSQKIFHALYDNERTDMSIWELSDQVEISDDESFYIYFHDITYTSGVRDGEDAHLLINNGTSETLYSISTGFTEEIFKLKNINLSGSTLLVDKVGDRIVPVKHSSETQQYFNNLYSIGLDDKDFNGVTAIGASQIINDALFKAGGDGSVLRISDMSAHPGVVPEIAGLYYLPRALEIPTQENGNYDTRFGITWEYNTKVTGEYWISDRIYYSGVEDGAFGGWKEYATIAPEIFLKTSNPFVNVTYSSVIKQGPMTHITAIMQVDVPISTGGWLFAIDVPETDEALPVVTIEYPIMRSGSLVSWGGILLNGTFIGYQEIPAGTYHISLSYRNKFSMSYGSLEEVSS